MTRRGQCRCGAILKFELTSLGYKTRCSSCNAIVRLRDGHEKVPRPAKKRLADLPPPPPLPTDLYAPALPDVPEPSGPPDFNVLERHESSAPVALAEMEAYIDEALPVPPKPSLGFLWMLLAVVMLLVLIAIGMVAVLLI